MTEDTLPTCDDTGEDVDECHCVEVAYDSNYVDDWPEDDTPTTAFDEAGGPAWDEDDEADQRFDCEREERD